jgi:hypothetical protein
MRANKSISKRYEKTVCINNKAPDDLCSGVEIFFLRAMVTEKSVFKPEIDNADYLGSKSISAKSVCINNRVEAYTHVESICRRVLNTLFQQTSSKFTIFAWTECRHMRTVRFDRKLGILFGTAVSLYFTLKTCPLSDIFSITCCIVHA